MTDALKVIEENLAASAKRDAPAVLKVITDPDIKLPDWAVGPFKQEKSMAFFPEQWKPANPGDTWKFKAIFNPSLIEKDGALHMIYRASPEMESIDSRIGLAVYRDGIWVDYENNPVLYAETEKENLGLEDPKIYRAENNYYMFYNAVNVHPAPEGEMPLTPHGDIDVDICLCVSDDLKTWKKKGLVVPHSVSKGVAKGAVIARNSKGEAVKIGGEYLMFLSAGCGGYLYVGHSTDMENWKFRKQKYLDLSKYGHIEEVACAVTEDNWDYFILDVYYIDISYNQLGVQVYYDKKEPYKQKKMCQGATFSWGGLVKYNGKRVFGQGWDAPRDRAGMLFYTEIEKKGV